MTVANIQACTCPLSPDSLVCAQCGGTLSIASGIISKVDLVVQEWFYVLETEGRLNPTLMTYMMIDRQIRQGAPVSAAVHEAVREIGAEITSIGQELERRLIERFSDLKVGHESAVRLLRDAVVQHVDSLVNEVKSLSEQGKSVTEIKDRIIEATSTLQTCLTAFRLPNVKGEEGEVNMLRDLQDSFLGQSCVRVEPIGGADATDTLIKFYHGDVEIGRCLVEVKSRNTWSNDYLVQVRDDLKRYCVPFAVLAVDKLPKVAKTRGFHVDTEIGVVITTSPGMVVPTITMFYEVYATCYRLGKRALSIGAVTANRDLAFYVNDNMRILENCKRINDITEDSTRMIREQVGKISARLQENGRKIAEILVKVEADT